MYVMKKFYLSIMALVGLTVTAMAQPDPDCPLAAGFVFSQPASPTFCKLVIGNLPLGETNTTGSVTMFNDAGFVVPDINGVISQPLPSTSNSISIEFGCQTIKRVEVNFWLGGVLKECTVFPAPPAPMPVKLTAFNGKLNTETEATLSWSTSMEENSYQYEVQRSADGKNYITVGKVTASGTTFETVKYNFNDALPGTGAYFYRLKMVDLDGKSEMSKSVYVNSKKGSGIVTSVFPNPFKNEIQLVGATSADLNTPGAVQVYTLAGQRINFRIVGANAISIADNAPKGIYILKVKNGTTSQQFKLVKE
jgi:hypothetical protein